ncbi:MAG: hypothetical protein ACJA05_002596 [Porticoccus sp.]|jgi:hypothetical protein|uniref:hypothetical protein n=1 Tax=Porticoccus sp. TaxID=2024853 RepID=UPI0039E64113
MIISHKYKYLFVEVPHTGSTSISEELIANYHGHPILKKHSQYIEFLRQASEDEKKYYIFSGVRNPLDEAVSVFLKIKNNHKGNYTSPDKLKVNGGFITDKKLKIRKYVEENNSDFGQYLIMFFKKPFDNMNAAYFHKMDYIIRFEQIAEEFSYVIEKNIGIDLKRALPIVNKTQGKESFLDYYDSEEVIEHALDVFGPFILKWGYKIPDTWDGFSVSALSILKFRVFEILRKIYYNNGYRI